MLLQHIRMASLWTLRAFWGGKKNCETDAMVGLCAGSWLCWASDKRGSWHADAADRGEFGLRNIVLNNVPTCSPAVLYRQIKRWMASLLPHARRHLKDGWKLRDSRE